MGSKDAPQKFLGALKKVASPFACEMKFAFIIARKEIM